MGKLFNSDASEHSPIYVIHRMDTRHLNFFIPKHFRGELLTLRNIEKLHKKPKADKETRLATAMVRPLLLKRRLSIMV